MEKKARVNVKVTNCNISLQCACVYVYLNAHVYAVCGGTYNTCGGIKNAYIIYFGTSGIKVCLRETVCECVDWIQMA